MSNDLINAFSHMPTKRLALLLVSFIALLSITTNGFLVAQDQPFDPSQFDSQEIRFPDYEFEASFSLKTGTRLGQLDVTLYPGDGFHAYPQYDFPGQTATTITVSSSVLGPQAIKQIGVFIPNAAVHDGETINGEVYRAFKGPVTWSARIELAEGVDEATLEIPIEVTGQVCTEGRCTTFDPQQDGIVAKFGEYRNEDPVPFSSMAGNGGPTAPVISMSSLISYLGMAFLAGLILNAMPCVLPVIGLKVMSFVKQAGENRYRVLMLNLAFSAGLMVVFLLIATLAAFFGMGWGDWLTKSLAGSIIITGVVFVFALSMLGVWEIPIPGLASGGGKKEDGLSGAFALGILTTILATPCTGPMLVPATAVVVGQPAWVAYLIFTSLGLGMALPYILIGIFPKLVSWLPKPGPWMDTFKQITGFILLGTVVFLLAGFSEEPRSDYLVATLTALLGIGFGCWWIGSAAYFTEKRRRQKAWIVGIGLITTTCSLAFAFMGPPAFELDWRRFNTAEMKELAAKNQLVLIDFTGPN